MRKFETPVRIRRRQLLTFAPAAGVAAVASSASAGETPGDTTAVTDPRQPKLGHTEHIRTYYRLARQ